MAVEAIGDYNGDGIDDLRVRNGNDLAAGSAQLSIRVGGEDLAVQQEAVQVREATAQELSEAAQGVVLDIASRLWAQLDAQDRGKISSGL